MLEQVDNLSADLALPFLIFIKFNFRLALASGLAGPRFQTNPLWLRFEVFSAGPGASSGFLSLSSSLGL